MLARTPARSLRDAAPERDKRLSRDRSKAIRDKIVVIMRHVEPTPFAAEGPCRHGIRASLCLQGWRWANADAVAAEIVAAALNIAGAKRPNWYEGQPEWTQPGALPILRERCARCSKPLPEGHRLWCSDVCAHAAKMDRQRQRWDEESYAQWKALKAAWIERQPEQRCEGCDRLFKPKRKGQRYCRYDCTRIT
jgi:predicted nucleic acid-binding Zn ribbon protein